MKYNISIILCLVVILWLSIALWVSNNKQDTYIVSDTSDIHWEVDTVEVQQVANELRCWENYSDKCSVIFWICGSRDYPNTLDDTYSNCVVEQYKTYNK